LGLPQRCLPDNDASDEAHRLFMAWLLREVIQSEVDLVFTSEEYGPGFASVLSQQQQLHGGRAVAHVEVDPARRSVPVSGTAVRADLHAQRQQLAPQVYRDFVRRVVLLGGESTGKSTLAWTLATRCGSVYATEYGRVAMGGAGRAAAGEGPAAYRPDSGSARGRSAGRCQCLAGLRHLTVDHLAVRRGDVRSRRSDAA
jgi:hypothetical protein